MRLSTFERGRGEERRGKEREEREGREGREERELIRVFPPSKLNHYYF